MSERPGGLDHPPSAPKRKLATDGVLNESAIADDSDDGADLELERPFVRSLVEAMARGQTRALDKFGLAVVRFPLRSGARTS